MLRLSLNYRGEQKPSKKHGAFAVGLIFFVRPAATVAHKPHHNAPNKR